MGQSHNTSAACSEPEHVLEHGCTVQGVSGLLLLPCPYRPCPGVCNIDVVKLQHCFHRSELLQKGFTPSEVVTTMQKV